MNELLRPRFWVTQLYPGCPFQIGEILTLSYGFHPEEAYLIHDNTSSVMRVQSFREYPKIFVELAWHEKRHFNDLPIYVKYNELAFRITGKQSENDRDNLCALGCLQVTEWYKDHERGAIASMAGKNNVPAAFLLPCTEAQYKNQQVREAAL